MGMSARASLCEFPAQARADIASAGFCVHKKHGICWPYAAAVWKIDGRLYCDECARKLR
jgi:hypothetical protein